MHRSPNRHFSTSVAFLQGFTQVFPALSLASQVVWVVKNLPANGGDARDADLILGWGRSPGVGIGTLLQNSCLEKFHGQRCLAGYSLWSCKAELRQQPAPSHTCHLLSFCATAELRPFHLHPLRILCSSALFCRQLSLADSNSCCQKATNDESELFNNSQCAVQSLCLPMMELSGIASSDLFMRGLCFRRMQLF